MIDLYFLAHLFVSAGSEYPPSLLFFLFQAELGKLPNVQALSFPVYWAGFVKAIDADTLWCLSDRLIRALLLSLDGIL